MYRKKPLGWAKHWDFILLDTICVLLAYMLAIRLRLPGFSLLNGLLYQSLAFVIVLVNVVVAIVFNTFSNALKQGYYQAFLSELKHVALALLIDVFFTFTVKTGQQYSRLMILMTAVFHLALGYGVRCLFKTILHKRKKASRRALFLVTTTESAEDAVRSIQSDISGSIQITGIAIIDRDLTGQEIEGIPVTANRDTVIDFVCREWIDEVFFRVPRDSDDYEYLFHRFMEMGLTMHMNIGKLSTYRDQHQQVEKIGQNLVLTVSINTINPVELILKRAIDILGGLVGSLIALLIMACVAIPIKRKSPGPLLYTAERIGLNGKRFRMYKIRSMYLDADARKKELMAQNRVKDGMMFKLDWDPRIIGNETLPDGSHKTGIGEFIRRTSLDEFPQFFNVLKGEMSLVGTRPPTPDEWEKYEVHHRARLATKPGITGMWQVSGRSDITDFEEVVRLDTEYITNWNLGLDVRILLKTVVAVFKGKGAM